jgi:transcriptional regulator with XRE-family HTH domain
MQSLRARGLTITAIARQFGVSRQAVQSALHRPRIPRGPIRCRHCGVTLSAFAPMAGLPPLSCSDCLSKVPHIPFAVRLVSLRIAAGLTQVALAEAAGVSQALVSRLERGQRRPKARTREVLLSYLELVLSKGRDDAAMDRMP